MGRRMWPEGGRERGRGREREGRGKENKNEKGLKISVEGPYFLIQLNIFPFQFFVVLQLVEGRSHERGGE